MTCHQVGHKTKIKSLFYFSDQTNDIITSANLAKEKVGFLLTETKIIMDVNTYSLYFLSTGIECTYKLVVHVTYTHT
jgi:hypothetical protein